MKITQKEVKPVFAPVVITIETQEELDYITTALGHAPYSDAFPVGNYRQLKAYGGNFKS